MEKPKNHPQSLLEAVFNFTPEELELNQQGYLSDEQQKQTQKVKYEEFIGNCFLFSMVIPFFLCTCSSAIAEGGDYEVLYFLLPAIIITLLLCFGVTYISNKRVKQIIGTPCVKSISGMIILSPPASIRIGNQQFNITAEQLYALKNGEYYCLYYVIKYHRIVSVEALYPPPDDLPY